MRSLELVLTYACYDPKAFTYEGQDLQIRFKSSMNDIEDVKLFDETMFMVVYEVSLLESTYPIDAEWFPCRIDPSDTLQRSSMRTTMKYRKRLKANGSIFSKSDSPSILTYHG